MSLFTNLQTALGLDNVDGVHTITVTAQEDKLQVTVAMQPSPGHEAILRAVVEERLRDVGDIQAELMRSRAELLDSLIPTLHTVTELHKAITRGLEAG